MQVEYSIMDHFLQLLKFWWVIVILAVAGGVFGYEVSTVRTPVYESKGVITVGIDFVKSGQLTDVEEDQALNNATDIAGSSTVMKLVVEATQGKGIDLTLDELAKIGSSTAMVFKSPCVWNHQTLKKPMTLRPFGFRKPRRCSMKHCSRLLRRSR